MQKIFLFIIVTCFYLQAFAQKPVPQKPRILISTDIGGTDPDDNQSMAHLLMYNNLFTIEGLISSPSYGSGNKEEILRMIDLYEKDLPLFKKRFSEMAQPDYLRKVTKQGQKGSAPYVGYSKPNEGSNWIIHCAKKKSKQKLWILVWGGLEDLAQALHDAPEIQKNIRVYWIGGPNKKWSANAYAYIAQNFPNLWIIENNSSYYGFFSKNNEIDRIEETDFYENYLANAGNLGRDFKNYYKGKVKMGDTPSLLYMMDGDPENPLKESWGGRFQKIKRSSKVEFHQVTSRKDTIAFCTSVSFTLNGPAISAPIDSVAFWMETPYQGGTQKWAGYYLGNGTYGLHFVPKQAEVIAYQFTSRIPGFPVGSGEIVVTNQWPGKNHPSDYLLGPHWYSDITNSECYDGKIQGGKTVSKWRQTVMDHWKKRIIGQK